MASQNCFEEIPLELAQAQQEKLNQMYNTYHGKLEQIKEESGKQISSAQVTLAVEESFDVNGISKVVNGQKN